MVPCGILKGETMDMVVIDMQMYLDSCCLELESVDVL
jgi:hypothetical protein